MWLCCPPWRKTLRPVFSRRGSDAKWVSYVHRCVRCASFQTKIQFSILEIFYTVVAKCDKKYATYQRILHQLLHFDKTQSVDAFCTKNFSLMQNASTLPTHFVTKNQKNRFNVLTSNNNLCFGARIRQICKPLAVLLYKRRV